MLSRLFAPDLDWGVLGLATLVAAVLAWVVAEAAARAVRALLAAAEVGEDAALLRQPIVRRPFRIARAVVFAVAFLALAAPAVQVAGARVAGAFGLSGVTAWLLGSGLRILIIALFAYVLIRLTAAAAHRLEDRIEHEAAGDHAEELKRARTLGHLVRNGLNTLVLAAAVLMGLRELGVDVMPVLAGAGILGLAVGFGAQTLVKDFISGFFLILENQVRVGDVAMINGTGGLVETIRLRTIVLRDLHGIVHVFPNGSINTLSNMTKDFSYAVLDVGVAYKEDTDRVTAVLREVGAELAADAEHGPNVLEPIEVLGVDAFGDSQVTLRIRIKTVPTTQWAIGRELRRRIKKAFDAQGIEIPFPHLSVYFGEASKPIAWRQAS